MLRSESINTRVHLWVILTQKIGKNSNRKLQIFDLKLLFEWFDAAEYFRAQFLKTLHFFEFTRIGVHESKRTKEERGQRMGVCNKK